MSVYRTQPEPLERMMRRSTTILAPILCLTVFGCANPAAQLEANKGLVRRFTEAANNADWESLNGIVAADFARHSAATTGPPITSRDEFVRLQESFLVTFPDQRVTIQNLIAEGDRVAVLATYTASHTGPMGEIPATGKSVESPFLAIFRIESGRIAELWVEWDNVALLTQLGLFPPPVQPSS
ncbi:MAG: ester cyclase [Gemmatimonadales bacterium]|nr:MAG: ester cyclase [Gemmatimonadales bacterium]